MRRLALALLLSCLVTQAWAASGVELRDNNNKYVGLCTYTQSVVVLPPATSTQLIGAVSPRGLSFQNVGANPATVVPGASAAVAGQDEAVAAGASLPFPWPAVPTNAFQAISTAGTTIVVWSCN